MEPSKHQYDYDSASVIGFLKEYGLEKDFKLNIEVNHATLTGHTFDHELQVAVIQICWAVLMQIEEIIKMVGIQTSFQIIYMRL